MPRPHRVDVVNEYYHVINRASARLTIFDTKEEFNLFEAVLVESCEK